jgi:RND family efflux transporter MFP subunit
MKTRFLPTLAVVAVAGCGASAGPAAQGPPPPARTARTVPVVRTAAGVRLIPATVATRQRATLAARVMAAVRSLPVAEGQSFRAGAVLVTLDDRALRAALRAAEAEQTRAAADLRRLEALVERGAATPREKEGAAAGEAAARAGVDAAREQLSYTTLRAPFAGRVASRPANVGDVVAPGQPVLEIEGAGGYEAQATVDSAVAARLAIGQSVDVDIDGLSGVLRARVTAVSRSGDAFTHRFLVKAALEPVEGLRSGLFARLRVPADGQGGRLTVPAAATVERGGLSGVWVVEGGQARLRWVALGRAEGDDVEVRAGVREGERVVLETDGLTDGVRVVETR